jgi:hypothetical protein
MKIKFTVQHGTELYTFDVQNWNVTDMAVETKRGSIMNNSSKNVKEVIYNWSISIVSYNNAVYLLNYRENIRFCP